MNESRRKVMGRRQFMRELVEWLEKLTQQEKADIRDGLLKWSTEDRMFVLTRAGDWICPAGHRRELLGPEGARRLRRKICEGYEGTFLTAFDHEFLRDAGVKIQAD